MLADERAEAELYRSLAGRRNGRGPGDPARHRRGRGAPRRALGASCWATTSVRPQRGSLRTRALIALARRFGSVFVLALVQQAESRTPYAADLDATRAMAADERVHEEVVRGLAARGRARVSGTFRAAVFGANDGLVSNLALVLGVSGGGVSTNTILLTGLAGLLAGALSMGAGEWISVRSQRELLTASAPSLGTHAWSPTSTSTPTSSPSSTAPGACRPTRRSGGPTRCSRSQEALYETTSTEALDAVGSDLAAGLSSFAFFASGAAVPVLPFAFGLSETPALIVACVLVGLALLVTGAIVGVLSGGPPLARALRQLAIGLGAAAITYAVGSLAGAALG